MAKPVRKATCIFYDFLEAFDDLVAEVRKRVTKGGEAL